MSTSAVCKAALSGLGIALLSATAAAGDFNFGINNHSIDAGIIAPASASSQLSGEYFYHDHNGETLGLGFQVTNRTAVGNVELGGKLIKLWSDRRDNARVVAIGGGYSLPLAHKVSLDMSLYYAPSVLASSGAERYYDADLKLAFSLMPNADLFLGYRDTHFKFERQPDLTLEQGTYVGARLKF